MTEYIAGRQIGVSAERPKRASETPTAARYLPGHRGVAVLSLLLTALIARYCYWNEGSGWNILFVASVTLLIALSVLLLTRRVLVSAVVASAAVAIIVMSSTTKVELMHMTVHAYDLVYYLSSPATLSFLWTSYPLEMAKLFGAFAALGAGWYVIHRIDVTRVPRHYSGLALIGVIAFVYYAAQYKDARQGWRQFEDGLALSKFYGSWSETVDTMWRGQLLESAAQAHGPAFTIPATCQPDSKPPHIILIHQESVVPPEYFPALKYDKSVDPMFRSGDGELHKLRVETYAGASWLTEFSILAGVSTYSFGSMRTFVQALMADKVRDTLPQALARCGYRNTVVYPLNKNFVSNGRFYEAVGMPEIFDMKAQGASPGGERDRFYYGTTLKLLESHIKSSSQPMFTFLLTMVTHQPYHNTYMPELDVPGGGPGTEPGMHEFLRRLSMAHLDYKEFKKELARRFPNERFLIVHYGDHQPTTTWSYLTDKDHTAIRSGESTLARHSLAFITYYAVEGINFEPKRLPQLEAMDVPYLGLMLLESAGLPLSDSYRERKRLMALCQGRYDSCEQRQEVMSFHRRLIDSGLIDAR